MDMKTKITMGVMIGLFTLLAIGGVMAANDTTNTATANAGYGNGYGPRDGSGYGRGQGRGMMGQGFANNANFEECPMHQALEAQGVTDEDFAQLHQEMYESGQRGPQAMRALLESKGIDTSDFPEPGFRNRQQ